MKTIRVRRSRPSAVSIALALMLTMLCVYLITLSAAPKTADIAATGAGIPAQAEVRMEGLSAQFLSIGASDSADTARITAAGAVRLGGAGLILADANHYFIVSEAFAEKERAQAAFDALQSANARLLERKSDGLTLQVSGSADEVAAVQEAVGFLYAQANETAQLSASLASGGTDAKSIVALLEVYLTRAEAARKGLEKIQADDPIVVRLKTALDQEYNLLTDSKLHMTSAQLKYLYAANRLRYIELSNALKT